MEPEGASEISMSDHPDDRDASYVLRNPNRSGNEAQAYFSPELGRK
jgi:hypothetical protein